MQTDLANRARFAKRLMQGVRLDHGSAFYLE
jgi:hypothetical protein